MKRPQPSSLITTTAWCVIISSLFMGLFALLQTTALFFFVPKSSLDLVVEQARATHMIPEYGIVILANLRWLVLGLFVLSVFFIRAGVGLLRREEWARKALVTALGLSIVAMLPGFFIRLDLGAFPLPLPEEMKASLILIQNGLLAMNATFCLVHGWLIWKLSTPLSRAEFSPSTKL